MKKNVCQAATDAAHNPKCGDAFQGERQRSRSCEIWPSPFCCNRGGHRKCQRKMLEENSTLSIRVGALVLGMSNISYWRAVEEAGFRPFRPTKVQELSEDGFVKRQEFCETMLALFDENPRLVDIILWSDESKFMLNGTVNRHNCCYYSYSNQHQLLPIINSKDGVMVWCGLTSKGPTFSTKPPIKSAI